MNPLFVWFARVYYRLSGWRIEGTAPAGARRYVIIAAPHTSNWDGYLMLVASYLFGIRIRWFVKDSLFFWPMGFVLRRFGGIPIDRSARRNMVESVAALIQQSEDLVVAIPPEGTRAYRPHWKTGFYYIALKAGVPIVLGYVDYRRKVAGLGPAFQPTGDIAADFKVFAEFYKDVTARYPDRVGPVLPPPEAVAGALPDAS